MNTGQPWTIAGELREDWQLMQPVFLLIGVILIILAVSGCIRHIIKSIRKFRVNK